jgi:uncharacterized MAPEG superfamily protein
MTNHHFTLAYACILMAAVLPILCAGASKFGKGVGYDNENPRQWMQQQTGWRARANAAQANGFETLPFFIGAVIVAHQLQANPMTLDALAATYVGLRVAYIYCYIANAATLRSMCWGAAFFTNVAIMLLGAWR